MTNLAFGQAPVAQRPVQGRVVAIGKETIDVVGGATRYRNVTVAKPLDVEQIHLHDVVALLWSGDAPFATSVLGHDTAYKRDPYRDTTPPSAPVNVTVVQSPAGPYLKWSWGGSEDRTVYVNYFEVDARLPGGVWGYGGYPVSEGTRQVHYPRFSNLALQVRVRAVDWRGNASAWVVCDTLLLDQVAPPSPTGLHVVPTLGGVLATWVGPTPSTCADLAGFRLYRAEDSSGSNASPVQTIGPGLTMTYVVGPSQPHYYNLAAFDVAGNESDYAVSEWIGCSAQAQGLQNSSFEFYSGGDVTSWTLTTSGPVATSHASDEVHDGAKSIKFVVSDGNAGTLTELLRHTPYLEVEQGDPSGYYFSGYVKASAVLDPANAFKVVVWQYQDASGTPCAASTKTADLWRLSFYQSTDWYMCTSPVVLDSDCRYVQVGLGIAGTTYAQSVWVDKCYWEYNGPVGSYTPVDDQAVNVVYAGPSSGDPAPPAFRALVDADIPATITRDSELSSHAGDANAHHSQVHAITGGDHSIVAAEFQVVGATASHTLGMLTPSYNPGAAAALLRTDTSGDLVLETATVGTLTTDLLDATEITASGTRSTSFTINSLAQDVTASLIFERTTGGQAYVTWNGTVVGVNKAVNVSGALTIDGTLDLGAGNRTVQASGDLVLSSGASNQVKIGSNVAAQVVYSATAPTTTKVGMIWVIE